MYVRKANAVVMRENDSARMAVATRERRALSREPTRKIRIAKRGRIYFSK
jgi:hypothetical protein